jgi:hypothetical protein
MADVFVFLVSPDSVASEICDWEINEAERLNKRIIPVVCRQVSKELVPGRLQRLNYVFLINDTDRAVEFPKLLTALQTDVTWSREHTRLGLLAKRWIDNARSPDQLLRGADIDAAERWAALRPNAMPSPTGDQLQFIDASHAQASRHV